MEFLLLLTFLVAPVVGIDLAVFLLSGKRFIVYGFQTVLELYLLIWMPFWFLEIQDFGKPNDCCSESALFSPAHRASIYLLIVLCLCAYSYSKFRTKLAPPLLELLVNGLLIVAIVLNIFIAIHLQEGFLWLFGNAPIIVFFLYRLLDNHHFILEQSQIANESFTNTSRMYAVLRWSLLIKIPLFLLIAIPFLTLFACILLLFGQKPDSLILAFTETYKHGLSELDCSNVTCPDGHFLCTIAASGHKRFVKPLRVGVRQNITIKVNRQLLVSNAFEDLLAERSPWLHRHIRHLYNLLGGNCKRVYDILGNKWIADIVYVLMKPFEWIFIVNLYLFDRKPENRIAKQYLYSNHRSAIEKMKAL